MSLQVEREIATKVLVCETLRNELTTHTTLGNTKEAYAVRTRLIRESEKLFLLRMERKYPHLAA